MLLALATLVPAVLVGYLRGGRLRRLTEVRLAGLPVIGVAVAAQAALALLSVVDGPVETVGRGLLAASLAAVLAFVWINRRLPGMWLVAIGFLLNAAVILPNGAMPVSPEAIAALGGDGAIDEGKHRLLTDGDVLPWLADVIPVPGLRIIVSVGDILLALGVAVLVARLMRGLPRHARSAREHRLA